MLTIEERRNVENDSIETIRQIEEVMGLQFTQKQIDIIKHEGGPANVISCAGSGKTTLLIAKLLYMQKKCDVIPEKIIVISFNKSAVEEIQQRYKACARKLDMSEKITFKTFHALYYMILKYYSVKERKEFNVLGDTESSMLFNQVFYSVSKNKDDDTKDNIKAVRSYAINNLITSSSQLFSSSKFLTSDVTEEDYLNVIDGYKNLKIEENKLDFEDLQIEMLKLLQENEDARNRVQSAWDYWFIDEYQDISKVQIEILNLSMKDPNKLMTIGDEDQAIYEFRGSKVDYIVDFPIYFNNSKRYVMDINYRCPEVILEHSERLIDNNKKRINKKMKASNSGGKLIYQPTKSCSQASIIIAEEVYQKFIECDCKLSEIVVLYRNTKQQMFVVDQMIEKGVPIKVMRTSNLIHNHMIVRDIRGIIDLALDDKDSYSFSKVFTKITSYIRRNDVRQISRQMVNTGKSWRELMEDYENDTLEKANIVLETIKSMVEKKYKMSDIIKEILKIYTVYLDFIATTNNFTKDEIDDLIQYLNYVARDMTYKKFVYYLERAKSLIELYSKDSEAVTVTTMHTVKGLEYDYVYILDASDNVIPNYKREESIRKLFGNNESVDYVEQERRLFYVACTRARKELMITYDDSLPSRFIEEQINLNNYTNKEESGPNRIIIQ